MASPLEPKPSRFAANWTHEKQYASLLEADAAAFAWEWLRRSTSYKSAFFSFAGGQASPPCQEFGLESYEHPHLSVPDARPMWSARVSPDVLKAHVSDPFAPSGDRIDLRLLSGMVTISITHDEIEHLLLCDGSHFIRIDVMVGTLIGCPASLTYLLHGLAGLKGPLRSLERLAALARTGRILPPPARLIERRKRWISELRVADALTDGADQQKIARVLFGEAISSTKWRMHNASHRARVQRLVAQVRSRQRNPLGRWFVSASG